METFNPRKGLHKIVDGVAVRTDAAKRRERHIVFRRAGIPEIHLDTSIDDLKISSVWNKMPGIKNISKPMIYWIEADSMNDRALASWVHLLKEFIAAGKNARHAKIKHIIEAQFDADEKGHWRSEIRSLDLLVLDLTNTDNHKMLPSLFADIHAERSRMKAMTVYLSDDDIGIKVGKYGDFMAKIFKDRKGLRRISPRNSTGKK